MSYGFLKCCFERSAVFKGWWGGHGPQGGEQAEQVNYFFLKASHRGVTKYREWTKIDFFTFGKKIQSPRTPHIKISYFDHLKFEIIINFEKIQSPRTPHIKMRDRSGWCSSSNDPSLIFMWGVRGVQKCYFHSLYFVTPRFTCQNSHHIQHVSGSV